MEESTSLSRPSLDFLDEDFMCPISMELMEDPVTICTGVTYERKNIEAWFKKYKKNTCPATMQILDNFEMTPNHTLQRLIQSWKNGKSQAPSTQLQISSQHDELVSLLKRIESTPFKVSYLKKLRPLIATGDEIKKYLVNSGGVDMLVKIVVQILVDCSDFAAFRACEEALIVMHQLLLVCEDDHQAHKMLLKPECIKACALMLQRGSQEARFCAVLLFQKMAKADYQWDDVIQDEGIGFFKSLLEIVSDEIYTKSSSSALQILIDMLDVSKKSRLKAIEAGAVFTLIELLPDSSRPKCERIMHLIKLICECAEGRLAFVEHGLGIAAVSKKILNVSTLCTKIGVKIVWLICNSHPRESILEDMLSSGGVKKLVALLHISGQSSTKDRASNILKLHGVSWQKYPCFPKEINEYLEFVNVDFE